MGDLDKATRPEPTDDPGRFTLVLDEQWRIGEKMHGGYLLAVLARAGVAAVDETRPGHTAPQSVTGTFLRAPAPGPASLTVDTLRTGRGVSQVRVRLDQDGASCVEAALVLGGLPDGPRAGDVSPVPEDVAPIGECPRSPADGGDGRGGLPIMEVVDIRMDPSTIGFLRGRPSGSGRVAGWISLDTGEDWTPSGLLVALDALPPASFELGLSGWSPTMSLTAHVHAVPAPGPLRAVQTVDHLAGDRMHETCRIWDTTDRLVGQSTQLAAVRR